MKKRVMSMLMVMIMMVSMLSVSVFAAHDGACTAAAEWSGNESAHWHACVTDGCEVTDVTVLPDYAAHTFDNTHKCTVCAYQGAHKWFENGSEAICTCGAAHTHALTYVNTDAAKHWQVCSECPVDAAKIHNEAAHTMVQNGTVNECSACGYTEHVHVWSTALSYDETNHWYACEDASCTATNGSAAHNWVKQDTSSATNNDYKCDCGATKAEHVHVWETGYTYDANTHWYKCIACSEKNGEAKHYDYNGTGICDAGDCNAPVANTLTTLTISGLTVPAEGAAVDFSVNVAESSYLDTQVKWNKVTNLKTNASVALGETKTFAAGEMYNTGILVRINTTDTVSENLVVTLDGVNVPFYKSKAAFDAAQKTYEGTNTVYMAREYWPATGQRYIMVCAMYAKLGGTHTHSFGSDWTESPAKHYMLCSGCDEIKDAAYHADTNKSGLCDVCNFEMKSVGPVSGTGTGTHTHTYGSDWVEDNANHWKQCTTCGAKSQTAAHADLNDTGKCDVCGFVVKTEAGHTHSYSTDWVETFAQHFKECSCGAKTEIAAHADTNKSGLCDVCGYAMSSTSASNGGTLSTVPNTGDNNATFLWLAAAVVSMMGLCGVAVVAKKRREE